MFNHLKLQWARVITLRAYRDGDWRKIPIKENGQPLVEVPEEIVFPYYYSELKIGENNKLYLREEVLEKILSVRRILERQGFDIRVYDGWRSVEIQESLFWYYMKLFTVEKFALKEKFDELKSTEDIKKCFGNLSPETRKVLFEANRTYVSWPTKDPLCPSPHATGGAVDVWLYRNGEAENLGVPFDWMEEDAGAFFHLKRKRNRFPGNDRRICKNREKMLLAMIGEGFTCYGPEVWHFNFGNQMDALVRRKAACYSYTEP